MGNYLFHRAITINPTDNKVGETDANYAVSLNLTAAGSGVIADFATVGNGGKIQNTAAGGASGAYTVPADLTFRTTADLSQAGANLDFEVEFYDAATGELIVHVQSGVIVSDHFDIYAIYSNADVTTSQENVAGTWDTNFKGVWHFGEASGAGAYIQDSTSNNNEGTPTGTTFVDGKVGKARNFAVSTDKIATNLNVHNWVSGAIEAWFNITNTAAGAVVDASTAGHQSGMWKGTKLIFANQTQGTFSGDTTLSTSTWYYGVLTWSATGRKIYLNGSQDGSAAITAAIDAPANIVVGHGAYDPLPVYGTVDELRISNTARTANHITTTHNNQSSPSTFYSMGAEQGIPLTADAVLKETQISLFTADAYLYTTSITADAVLKETQVDSFTANAYLSEIFTTDAVLKGTQSSSITAGAVLKGTLSDSFTANGVLLKTTTDTIAADAILKGTLADSFTADACLISDAVSPKQYLFTKAGLVYLPIFPLQPVSVSVSANHTADYRSIIFCDATSGSFTVTLPEAADNLDKVYTIKHTSGSHSVVVQGAETIDNAASQTLNELDVLRIISDNTSWYKI